MRTKTNFLSFCALSVCFLVSSCSNTVKLRGTVYKQSGEISPGTLVRLIVVDDAGSELSEYSTAVSDGDGRFVLNAQGFLSSNFLIRAELPQAPLHRFASANTDLDQISEALVQAVLWVTETEGGRSLQDFSREEIKDLANNWQNYRTDESLDASGELSDLTNIIVENFGRAIADAAGGIIEVSDVNTALSENAITPGPTFGNTDSVCASDNYLVTSQYFQFDVQPDGGLCDLRSVSGAPDDGDLQDGLDDGFKLSLSSETFTASPYFPGDTALNAGAPLPTVNFEDSRELVFGPVTTDSGDLNVTRKLMILEEGDIARYLEIFENNSTTETLEFDVSIEGDFGLENVGLLGAQNNDIVFDEESRYASFFTTVPNQDKPTLGFVLGGETEIDEVDIVFFPPINGDVFLYTWEDVSLAPGETAVFAHYFLLKASQNQSLVQQDLEAIYEQPNMDGLSVDEINNLKNFPSTTGNIVGEAGSVASYAQLTFALGNDLVVTQARRDGSFVAAIDAQTGDQVQIQSSDGLSQTLSVE